MTDELGQMPAHQRFKLCFPAVRPPQPLLGEARPEGEYLRPLLGFCGRLRGISPLIEVHHDVRALVLLPSLVGALEFVRCPGAGIGHGGAEMLPKNSDEDVAVLDA